MSGIAEVLRAHVQSVRNQRCECGWRPDGSKGILDPNNVYAQHRAHVADALEALGYGLVREARLAGAAIGWDAAVSRMTYEDGTPVEIAANVNPYRAADG